MEDNYCLFPEDNTLTQTEKLHFEISEKQGAEGESTCVKKI